MSFLHPKIELDIQDVRRGTNQTTGPDIPCVLYLSCSDRSHCSAFDVKGIKTDVFCLTPEKCLYIHFVLQVSKTLSCGKSKFNHLPKERPNQKAPRGAKRSPGRGRRSSTRNSTRNREPSRTRCRKPKAKPPDESFYTNNIYHFVHHQ